MKRTFTDTEIIAMLRKHARLLRDCVGDNTYQLYARRIRSASNFNEHLATQMVNRKVNDSIRRKREREESVYR